MFVVILTISIYLTSALEKFSPGEDISFQNSYNDSPYNIYEYIQELHLERCSLVGIGLKHYAIFIEDGTVTPKKTTVSKKFFLGICNQAVLEEWKFCSPALEKRRKRKCKFKIRKKKYASRVHRKFCDISVMVQNKDCLCQPTVYGDDMHKVAGFPTCFIPPLPDSLCKYSVCGLSKCKTTTIEKKIHTVHCDPNCVGGKPFCENPLKRTAITPMVKSSWSKWKEVNGYVVNKNNKRPQRAQDVEQKHSFAACINQFTRKGDIDCLGPGTGCCPEDALNCDCTTYIDRTGLKVERIFLKREKNTEANLPSETFESLLFPLSLFPRQLPSETEIISPITECKKHKRFAKHAYSYLDTDEEDIGDDDDEDSDLDEDIVLEEETTQVSITTTEELKKEEVLEELKQRKENLTAMTNVTKNEKSGIRYLPNVHSLLTLIATCLIVKTII